MLFPWSPVGMVGLERLAAARRECHHAVQILTRLARGYLAHLPDDSHTSLTWDTVHGALAGRPFGTCRCRLEVGSLRLVWLQGDAETAGFRLRGRTLEETIRWTQEQLAAAGFNMGALLRPLHFEIPPDPVAAGEPFGAAEPAAFAELERWFANASTVLEQLRADHDPASEVRCWPHHFDMATLLVRGSETIGVGLSPGDEWYGGPYFYVSPNSDPDPESLPPAPEGIEWHTAGWTGLVLPCERMLAEKTAEQGAWVLARLREAIQRLG